MALVAGQNQNPNSSNGNAARPTALGSSGLTVSKLGIGGAGIGSAFRAVSDTDANNALNASFSAGLRYFDTAPFYGFGQSEERLGKWLATQDRSAVTISSKVGIRLEKLSVNSPNNSVFIDVKPHTFHFDFRAESVKRSLDETLRRLGTDYLDIALIHDPDEQATLQGFDPETNSHFDEIVNETLPVLQELKTAGKIRAIGVGINQWQMPIRFAEHGGFDCFLLAYNYSLITQEGLPLLNLCAEKGIGILIGGPLQNGLLAGAGVNPIIDKILPLGRDEELLRRAQLAASICAKHDTTLLSASLQFAGAHPAVSSVVVGIRNQQELGQDIQAFNGQTPKELWTDLRDAGIIQAAAPTP